jgi:hypothetical protein
VSSPAYASDPVLTGGRVGRSLCIDREGGRLLDAR